MQRSPTFRKDTAVYNIRKAAIIGAGTMGGGIAMACANAGISVLLKEVEQAALDRGLATIRKNYENSVKKGRFSQEVMDQRMALIHPQLTYDGFEQADLIIEAAFESMELKKQHLCRDRQDRQARLRAGVQHLHARYRRDRVRHFAAAHGHRAAFFQPRAT